MTDFRKGWHQRRNVCSIKVLKVICRLLVTPTTSPWKLKGMKIEYSQYFIKAPKKQNSTFLLILFNKNIFLLGFLPNVMYS